MASRIMHQAIAKNVLQSFPDINPVHFQLGNLAPDLTKYQERSYENSHFAMEFEGTKGINYNLFHKKYSSEISTSTFMLGYLVHLVSDALWLKTVQQNHVRKYPKIKKELYKKGYDDMKMYNPILIRDYHLEMFKPVQVSCKLEEVDSQDFETLLYQLNKDFQAKYSGENFEVYPYESVKTYIELATNKSIEAILKVKNKVDLDDSRNFYVPLK